MIQLKPGVSKAQFFAQISAIAKQKATALYVGDRAKDLEIFMLRNFLKPFLITTPRKIKKK